MVDRGRLDFRKYLNFVDPRINRCDVREPLGDDFTPGNWEVICMGGKESFDHSKFYALTTFHYRAGRKFFPFLHRFFFLVPQSGTGGSEFALPTI